MLRPGLGSERHPPGAERPSPATGGVARWAGATILQMVIAGAAGSAAALAAAREYGRRLRERFGPRVVDLRLFGSTARGEAHEESDVDIAVVLDAVDWETRAQAIDLATTVGLELDLQLSPTVLDRATFERWLRQERALVRDIVEQGVAL